MVKQTVSHIDTKTAIRTKLIHLKSGEVLEDVHLLSCTLTIHKHKAPGYHLLIWKRYSLHSNAWFTVDADDSNANASSKKKTDKVCRLATAEKVLQKACKTLGELKKGILIFIRANQSYHVILSVLGEIKAKLGGDKWKSGMNNEVKNGWIFTKAWDFRIIS